MLVHTIVINDNPSQPWYNYYIYVCDFPKSLNGILSGNVRRKGEIRGKGRGEIKAGLLQMLRSYINRDMLDF